MHTYHNLQHRPLCISGKLSLSLDAVQQQTLAGEDARQALGELLQAALKLEFTVIPVYLSACFSLKQENEAIAHLLLRVAIEEMLHFTVVANTLNAIGIAPDIYNIVPNFPCDVDVIEPPLRMELRSFSLDHVRDLFLRIETPEEPIVFELSAPVANIAAIRPKTVGEFYQGIINIFEADTIPGLFDGDPATLNVPVIPNPPNFRPTAYRDDNDQNIYPIPQSIDFRITDRASVVQHLKWIVDQGEGTSRTDMDPIDSSGLPAHYYRFVSILKGRYLVANGNTFTYSGGSLRFDPTGVHENDPNPKAADYATHDRLSLHMNRFNRTYSDLINALADAFNSRDEIVAREAYTRSLDSMRMIGAIPPAIRHAAVQAGVKAGTPFEYQHT